MTEEERYFFDVNGYLVVENALDTDTLAAMNAYLDTQPDKDPTGKGKITAGSLLTWGQSFRDLVDNPRVLPYLKELLGDTLRLDHDYAIFAEKGGSSLVLHGGGTPYDPAQYYHCRNGQIFCGLTVASYALTPIGPGEGGFACIPGSHKASFPCPTELKNLDNASSSLVKQVPMKAGDCVLFTEALTHGTLPWTADHLRRSLFLKYSPKHMTWASTYYYAPETKSYLAELEGKLTDAQRILLDPPSVFQHRQVP